MSAPRQGPGDWNAGEAEWIDRVLDRAAEQISSAELFEDDARSEPVSTVTELPSAAPVENAPSRPQSPVRLSGAISASTFSTAGDGGIPGVRPLSPAQSSQPVLTITDPEPLTTTSIGHSAYTEELKSLAAAVDAPGDDLPWLSDSVADSGAADDFSSGKEDGFEALSAPRERGAIREWGPVLVLAVVVAVIFRMFLFTAYHIPSLSMAPTLDIGDRVVVNRLSYTLGDIDRGQVVVFSRPPGQVGQADHLIKRVIGLPGDTITVAEGHIWVDGRRLSEPYLAQEESSEPRTTAIPGCVDNGGSRTECIIPEGSVFVMGDNRRGSVDSRVFGPISQDSIVGRAFVRIWVLDNVGWL